MKKITSAILALLLAASMTACGEKAADTMEEVTAQTTAAETEKATEAVTTEDKQEETEAETTAEETTETTEAEQKKSEKDALIEDIISEYSKNSGNETHHYFYKDNTLVLSATYNHNEFTYNIDTKEMKELDKKPSYSLCFDGKVYNCINGVIYVYDTQLQLVDQFNDEKNAVSSIINISKENGIFVMYVDTTLYDYDRYGLISLDDLTHVTPLPEIEFDIGHGEKYIGHPVYMEGYSGDMVIVDYCVNGDEGIKRIDLSTMEVSDLDENLNANFVVHNTIRPLTGKYLIINGGSVYNLETGELFEKVMYDESDKYSQAYESFFVTDRAFYFTRDYKLWKYISETESELIYDGSSTSCKYDAVGEDYFLVSDRIGTFLVNRANGEETKIDLKL